MPAAAGELELDVCMCELDWRFEEFCCWAQLHRGELGLTALAMPRWLQVAMDLIEGWTQAEIERRKEMQRG